MFGLIRVKSHKRLLADAETLYNGRIQSLMTSQVVEVRRLFLHHVSQPDRCPHCGEILSRGVLSRRS